MASDGHQWQTAASGLKGAYWQLSWRYTLGHLLRYTLDVRRNSAVGFLFHLPITFFSSLRQTEFSIDHSDYISHAHVETWSRKQQSVPNHRFVWNNSFMWAGRRGRGEGEGRRGRKVRRIVSCSLRHLYFGTLNVQHFASIIFIASYILPAQIKTL